MKRPQGKKLLLLLLIGVLSVGLVGGAALQSLFTPTTQYSIYEGVRTESVFTITSYGEYPKGRNKITVLATLENGDSVSHSANVTAYALDAIGDVLAEESQLTGVIAAGDTISMTFTLLGAGIVDDFDDIQLPVHDLS